MTAPDPRLTPGQLASRSGLAPATLRFYERRGLITADRTTGNQRRYPRHTLRRLAFAAAAQRVGLTLADVHGLLAQLPAGSAPSTRDWTRLAEPWGRLVDARIRELQVLRGSLDTCIGCGCLSLTRCALFNPGDEAGAEGSGSRWVRRAAQEREPAAEEPGTS